MKIVWRAATGDYREIKDVKMYLKKSWLRELQVHLYQQMLINRNIIYGTTRSQNNDDDEEEGEGRG